MHDSREAADLAAIKARLAAAREAIVRGDAVVDCGAFATGQLGLSVAVCDKAGRIWRADGTKLVLVYSGLGTLPDVQAQ